MTITSVISENKGGAIKIASYGHMTSLSFMKHNLIISSTWTLTGTKFASASNTGLQTTHSAKYQFHFQRTLRASNI